MSEVRLAAKDSHLGKSADKSADRAPPLHVTPWHSPYNMKKKSRKKTSDWFAENFQPYTIHYINMATFYR